MPVGVPGLLRLRVVDRSPNFWYSDGFENPSGMTVQLWKSLGSDAAPDATLPFWTQVAGTWGLAAHVMTNSSSAVNDMIVGGYSAWPDYAFTCRFRWSTGGIIEFLVHSDGTNANHIFGIVQGTTLRLFKRIANVETQIGGSPAAVLTNTNFYWMKVTCTGTAYTLQLYNDTGPGTMGTLIQTVAGGTITDAAVQSGVVGIKVISATVVTIGGNFPNVCFVTGQGPDGQTASWLPVVTSGEPAFFYSTVSPRTGTYALGIFSLGFAASSGAWTLPTRLFAAANATISAYIKNTSSDAHMTLGSLVTPSATLLNTYGLVTISGAIPASGVISLVSTGSPFFPTTSYFDDISVINPAYEITPDLPHLHTSTWQKTAFLPGNSGSTAVGTFQLDLHPPGSPEFRKARATYRMLKRYQRVEAYISHDASGTGRLLDAGVITGINRTHSGDNGSFVVNGKSDLELANLSQPFPGELLSGAVTSALIKNYLGVNEPGWLDDFTAYNAANYFSTALPGGTVGTWTASTDEAIPVVTCSTGAGAVLISKVGAAANDSFFSQYAEITCRHKPSVDINDAGMIGVGLSHSNTDLNNSISTWVTPHFFNGRYSIIVRIVIYLNGVQVAAPNVPNALFNVDDPAGFVKLIIGILSTDNTPLGSHGQIVTVNGKSVLTNSGNFVAGTGACYPFLVFSVPASGSAQAWVSKLVQKTRFAADGPSSASTFAVGSIPPTTSTLGLGTDPGATFLDVWTACANRDNIFLRYTPQPYVIGTRTLGVVDMNVEPGTDYGVIEKVIFSRSLANLLDLGINDNADPLAATTAVTGQSTPDGGGIAWIHDIQVLSTIGAIEETILATGTNFDALHRGGSSIAIHKSAVDIAGAKTALILRDAATADVFRELDKVMLDDPELDVNKLVSRVVGISFTEGSETQTLTLDQFDAEYTGYNVRIL